MNTLLKNTEDSRQNERTEKKDQSPQLNSPAVSRNSTGQAKTRRDKGTKKDGLTPVPPGAELEPQRYTEKD
jgi:hypothetical protein